VDRRPRLRLDAVSGIAAIDRARQYLAAHQREQALETAEPAALGDPLMPAIGRQDAGGDQRLDQRRAGFLVRVGEVADAALQPAGARPSGLGAEDPAPQLA